MCNGLDCMLKEVIGSCFAFADVFGCCLRVVKTEPVLTQDHVCPYRHDELEHAYFSQFLPFGFV